jgi:hypothetical protein
MATKSDKDRKDAKADAVILRIAEIARHTVLLRGMDEHKLDMLILALGIGEVELREGD